MIKTIVIVVVVLLAVLLGYAAVKPDTFRIERTTSIKAAPEKIFPLINDLHQRELWSPWEKDDPAIKRTYTGAMSGKGAVYEWHSDKQAGQGRMEIIDSSPPSKVVLKIDFIKPMEGHNTVDFTIVKQGDTSLVTHAMYGPQPYLARLPKNSRTPPRLYDEELYKERHKRECLFGFFKHYRCLFSRFDKIASRFQAFLHFAAAFSG